MKRAGNYERGPQIRPVDPSEFRLATPKQKKVGRPRKLSAEQEAELLAWWETLKALGTLKQKAAQLNITKNTLNRALRRAPERKRASIRKADEQCAHVA